MKVEDVNNYASLVKSRLTPRGTTMNTRVLDLVDCPEEDRSSGESRQGLLYEGCLITFRYDPEKSKIFVRGTFPGLRRIKDGQVEELEDCLEVPERLSGNPKMRRTYLASVSRGSLEYFDEIGNSITVGYNVRAKDHKKVFEAFWFNFKPFLKMMKDSKTMQDSR